MRATDDTGTVTFTTIYPACYSGRWPHIHFEVHEDVANAVAQGPDRHHIAAGYEQSIRNVSGISLSTDTVFRVDDGI